MDVQKANKRNTPSELNRRSNIYQQGGNYWQGKTNDASHSVNQMNQPGGQNEKNQNNQNNSSNVALDSGVNNTGYNTGNQNNISSSTNEQKNTSGSNQEGINAITSKNVNSKNVGYSSNLVQNTGYTAAQNMGQNQNRGNAPINHYAYVTNASNNIMHNYANSNTMNKKNTNHINLSSFYNNGSMNTNSSTNVANNNSYNNSNNKNNNNNSNNNTNNALNNNSAITGGINSGNMNISNINNSNNSGNINNNSNINNNNNNSNNNSNSNNIINNNNNSNNNNNNSNDNNNNNNNNNNDNTKLGTETLDSNNRNNTNQHMSGTFSGGGTATTISGNSNTYRNATMPNKNRVNNAPNARVETEEEMEKRRVYQLIHDLCHIEKRENALLELSRKRETYQDIAPLLWNSFGTIAVLIQEIVAIYPQLSPPVLTTSASNRVCNSLALLQCVASHPETNQRFLIAHIPLYLYPFLNTESKNRPYEYLRLTSLGVIGALVKVDNPEVINFLLQTEIIPLCLRIMETGSELSKTVATFIVQKILIDEMGLNYICATPERFYAVSTVLANMVNGLISNPSSRLLKHIIRCYLRLSENPRALEALKYCLPDSLKQIHKAFYPCLKEDSATKKWLYQLLFNIKEESMSAFLASQFNINVTANGQATGQAIGQVTGQATGQTTGQTTGQSTGQATGQATGQTTGQATGQATGTGRNITNAVTGGSDNTGGAAGNLGTKLVESTGTPGNAETSETIETGGAMGTFGSEPANEGTVNNITATTSGKSMNSRSNKNDTDSPSVIENNTTSNISNNINVDNNNTNVSESNNRNTVSSNINSGNNDKTKVANENKENQSSAINTDSVAGALEATNDSNDISSNKNDSSTGNRNDGTAKNERAANKKNGEAANSDEGRNTEKDTQNKNNDKINANDTDNTTSDVNSSNNNNENNNHSKSDVNTTNNNSNEKNQNSKNVLNTTSSNANSVSTTNIKGNSTGSNNVVINK